MRRGREAARISTSVLCAMALMVYSCCDTKSAAALSASHASVSHKYLLHQAAFVPGDDAGDTGSADNAMTDETSVANSAAPNSVSMADSAMRISAPIEAEVGSQLQTMPQAQAQAQVQVPPAAVSDSPGELSNGSSMPVPEVIQSNPAMPELTQSNPSLPESVQAANNFVAGSEAANDPTISTNADTGGQQAQPEPDQMPAEPWADYIASPTEADQRNSAEPTTAAGGEPTAINESPAPAPTLTQDPSPAPSSLPDGSFAGSTSNPKPKTKQKFKTKRSKLRKSHRDVMRNKTSRTSGAMTTAAAAAMSTPVNYNQQPHPETPARSCPYIRVGAVYSVPASVSYSADGINYKLKPALGGLVGIGLIFNPIFSTDLTASYNPSYKYSNQGAKATVSNTSFMLNGYFNLPFFEGTPTPFLTPYIMGGAGLGVNRLRKYQCPIITGIKTTNSMAFMWQLGGGIKYSLGEHSQLDFAYKYSSGRFSHNVVGVTILGQPSDLDALRKPKMQTHDFSASLILFIP